ncbi:hypothetical protein GGI13_003721 [Coemansia sp. RSA 455]|nr:hypothetical protein H4S03_006122 [Coemansia sp. S3946]KAJ2047531.1 hypothetical protein H4S04_004389 [Coemansia sp. S16]KAJ2058683.1 hypothetical protein GGI08_003380 [Coemansia sp. S2]KAJ2066161.1 hypothetical protein GGH13_005827 [Coemansia sp. S155-1]KAJ2102877.1 hypothetical protein GGI09_000975 [Coemansia sp. S100]KAJ2105782.1 hypothetical protein GGI16_002207 [Coemansia sp. S142-1]KAJ2109076.1 hypothetical protein IW146_006535 [Coemansia sp. RSA 922]KAJ2251664.1 hypothetical protei
MIAHTISTFVLAAIYASAVTAAALPHQPADTRLESRDAPIDSRAALTKRCGCGGYGGCGCGGYGGYGGYGYGGYGYPFVSSFTNGFDRCSSCANYNENTLYANNVHADAACDNVHAFTNANVIA